MQESTVSADSFQEIGKRQKIFNEMDILHNDPLRNLQIHRCEVPDAFDAAGHQLIGHLLRCVPVRTDIGDIHGVLFKVVVDIMHIIDFHIPDLEADEPGVYVEHTLKTESELFEAVIIGQGLTQITCADDDGLIGLGKPENLGNLVKKFFNVIAVSLLSEAAKIIEVLTDLGGGESDDIAQFLRGNPLHILIQKLLKIPVIFRQTTDDRH